MLKQLRDVPCVNMEIVGGSGVFVVMYQGRHDGCKHLQVRQPVLERQRGIIVTFTGCLDVM